MSLLVAIVFVLLSPGPTVELKYKSEKDVTLRDESTRVIKLRGFSGARIVKHHLERVRVFDRTVVELDSEGRSIRERITVVKSVRRVVESPTEKAHEKNTASHGLSFVWKKRGKSWRLYDESGDVTKKFPTLVESLSNWRSARLPKDSVAVGDSWKVTAADFLRSASQAVPEGVTGECTFTLRALEGGIANIAFAFTSTWKDGSREITGTQEGTWLFDVRAGRDREFKMKGMLIVNKGKAGDGNLEMTRTVTRR